MGRKKKTKENNQINLNYNGSITVSIAKKGKIISTQKYHNNGTLELFKFFSYSLAGNYELAEALRPKYIRLYTLGDYGDNIPEVLRPVPTSTTWVMYKETPTTIVENGAAYTLFSFMIPFTQIDINQDTNYLVLYPNASSASPLAQFMILKPDTEPAKLGRLFEEVTSQNDYNLYITWKMNIKN